MFRITTLLFALLVSGCSPGGTYTKHGVTQYHGDGVIRDVSQSGWPFSTHGFVIELDKFDLGNTFDKQFRLVNVPTIVNRPFEICLAVEEDGLEQLNLNSSISVNKRNSPFTKTTIDDLRKKLAAVLTLSLTDSNGITVTGLSTNIGSLVWSSPVHGYKGFWLYSESGSFFTPRSGETYFLHVRYTPDFILRGKHGRIYLYSGYGGS